MKILLTTDSHMGFSQKTYQILEKKLKEIDHNSYDIVVHCGDWISHKQSQWKTVLKLFRNYIDKPILGVTGNHDLWDAEQQFLSLEDVQKYHLEMFKKYDIHYLERNPYIKDNISFYGFNGWYSNTNPPSNDWMRIPNNPPRDLNKILRNNAHRRLQEILIQSEKDTNQKICITHVSSLPYRNSYIKDDYSMAANPKYKNMIADVFDFYFMGHSHLVVQELHPSGCGMINAGSDYDQPKFMIIEL